MFTLYYKTYTEQDRLIKTNYEYQNGDNNHKNNRLMIHDSLFFFIKII